VAEKWEGPGYTPLHWASRDFWPEDFLVAKNLLKYGADVNAVTKKGHTPLYVALTWGRKRTGALLLEHGADVNMVYRLLPERDIDIKYAKGWMQDCRSKPSDEWPYGIEEEDPEL
jgi:ankyrin repeat protein